MGRGVRPAEALPSCPRAGQWGGGALEGGVGWWEVNHELHVRRKYREDGAVEKRGGGTPPWVAGVFRPRSRGPARW